MLQGTHDVPLGQCRLHLKLLVSAIQMENHALLSALPPELGAGDLWLGTTSSHGPVQHQLQGGQLGGQHTNTSPSDPNVNLTDNAGSDVVEDWDAEFGSDAAEKAGRRLDADPVRAVESLPPARNLANAKGTIHSNRPDLLENLRAMFSNRAAQHGRIGEAGPRAPPIPELSLLERLCGRFVDIPDAALPLQVPLPRPPQALGGRAAQLKRGAARPVASAGWSSGAGDTHNMEFQSSAAAVLSDPQHLLMQGLDGVDTSERTALYKGGHHHGSEPAATTFMQWLNSQPSPLLVQTSSAASSSAGADTHGERVVDVGGGLRVIIEADPSQDRAGIAADVSRRWLGQPDGSVSAYTTSSRPDGSSHVTTQIASVPAESMLRSALELQQQHQHEVLRRGMLDGASKIPATAAFPCSETPGVVLAAMRSAQHAAGVVTATQARISAPPLHHAPPVSETFLLQKTDLLPFPHRTALTGAYGGSACPTEGTSDQGTCSPGAAVEQQGRNFASVAARLLSSALGYIQSEPRPRDVVVLSASTAAAAAPDQSRPSSGTSSKAAAQLPAWAAGLSSDCICRVPAGHSLDAAAIRLMFNVLGSALGNPKPGIPPPGFIQSQWRSVTAFLCWSGAEGALPGQDGGVPAPQLPPNLPQPLAGTSFVSVSDAITACECCDVLLVAVDGLPMLGAGWAMAMETATSTMLACGYHCASLACATIFVTALVGAFEAWLSNECGPALNDTTSGRAAARGSSVPSAASVVPFLSDAVFEAAASILRSCAKISHQYVGNENGRSRSAAAFTSGRAVARTSSTAAGGARSSRQDSDDNPGRASGTGATGTAEGSIGKVAACIFRWGCEQLQAIASLWPKSLHRSVASAAGCINPSLLRGPTQAARLLMLQVQSQAHQGLLQVEAFQTWLDSPAGRAATATAGALAAPQGRSGSARNASTPATSRAAIFTSPALRPVSGQPTASSGSQAPLLSMSIDGTTASDSTGTSAGQPTITSTLTVAPPQRGRLVQHDVAGPETGASVRRHNTRLSGVSIDSAALSAQGSVAMPPSTVDGSAPGLAQSQSQSESGGRPASGTQAMITSPPPVSSATRPTTSTDEARSRSSRSIGRPRGYRYDGPVFVQLSDVATPTCALVLSARTVLKCLLHQHSEQVASMANGASGGVQAASLAALDLDALAASAAVTSAYAASLHLLAQESLTALQLVLAGFSPLTLRQIASREVAPAAPLLRAIQSVAANRNQRGASEAPGVSPGYSHFGHVFVDQQSMKQPLAVERLDALSPQPAIQAPPHDQPPPPPAIHTAQVVRKVPSYRHTSAFPTDDASAAAVRAALADIRASQRSAALAEDPSGIDCESVSRFGLAFRICPGIAADLAVTLDRMHQVASSSASDSTQLLSAPLSELLDRDLAPYPPSQLVASHALRARLFRRFLLCPERHTAPYAELATIASAMEARDGEGQQRRSPMATAAATEIRRALVRGCIASEVGNIWPLHTSALLAMSCHDDIGCGAPSWLHNPADASSAIPLADVTNGGAVSTGVSAGHFPQISGVTTGVTVFTCRHAAMALGTCHFALSLLAAQISASPSAPNSDAKPSAMYDEGGNRAAHNRGDGAEAPDPNTRERAAVPAAPSSSAGGSSSGSAAILGAGTGTPARLPADTATAPAVFSPAAQRNSPVLPGHSRSPSAGTGTDSAVGSASVGSGTASTSTQQTPPVAGRTFSAQASSYQPSSQQVERISSSTLAQWFKSRYPAESALFDAVRILQGVPRYAFMYRPLAAHEHLQDPPLQSDVVLQRPARQPTRLQMSALTSHFGCAVLTRLSKEMGARGLDTYAALALEAALRSLSARDDAITTLATIRPLEPQPPVVLFALRPSALQHPAGGIRFLALSRLAAISLLRRTLVARLRTSSNVAGISNSTVSESASIQELLAKLGMSASLLPGLSSPVRAPTSTAPPTQPGTDAADSPVPVPLWRLASFLRSSPPAAASQEQIATAVPAALVLSHTTLSLKLSRTTRKLALACARGGLTERSSWYHERTLINCLISGKFREASFVCDALATLHSDLGQLDSARAVLAIVLEHLRAHASAVASGKQPLLRHRAEPLPYPLMLAPSSASGRGTQPEAASSNPTAVGAPDAADLQLHAASAQVPSSSALLPAAAIAAVAASASTATAAVMLPPSQLQPQLTLTLPPGFATAQVAGDGGSGAIIAAAALGSQAVASSTAQAYPSPASTVAAAAEATAAQRVESHAKAKSGGRTHWLFKRKKAAERMRADVIGETTTALSRASPGLMVPIGGGNPATGPHEHDLSGISNAPSGTGDAAAFGLEPSGTGAAVNARHLTALSLPGLDSGAWNETGATSTASRPEPAASTTGLTSPAAGGGAAAGAGGQGAAMPAPLPQHERKITVRVAPGVRSHASLRPATMAIVGGGTLLRGIRGIGSGALGATLQLLTLPRKVVVSAASGVMTISRSNLRQMRRITERKRSAGLPGMMIANWNTWVTSSIGADDISYDTVDDAVADIAFQAEMDAQAPSSRNLRAAPGSPMLQRDISSTLGREGIDRPYSRRRGKRVSWGGRMPSVESEKSSVLGRGVVLPVAASDVVPSIPTRSGSDVDEPSLQQHASALSDEDAPGEAGDVHRGRFETVVSNEEPVLYQAPQPGFSSPVHASGWLSRASSFLPRRLMMSRRGKRSSEDLGASALAGETRRRSAEELTRLPRRATAGIESATSVTGPGRTNGAAPRVHGHGRTQSQPVALTSVLPGWSGPAQARGEGADTINSPPFSPAAPVAIDRGVIADSEAGGFGFAGQLPDRRTESFPSFLPDVPLRAFATVGTPSDAWTASPMYVFNRAILERVLLRGSCQSASSASSSSSNESATDISDVLCAAIVPYGSTAESSRISDADVCSLTIRLASLSIACGAIRSAISMLLPMLPTDIPRQLGDGYSSLADVYAGSNVGDAVYSAVIGGQNATRNGLMSPKAASSFFSSGMSTNRQSGVLPESMPPAVSSVIQSIVGTAVIPVTSAADRDRLLHTLHALARAYYRSGEHGDCAVVLNHTLPTVPLFLFEVAHAPPPATTTSSGARTDTAASAIRTPTTRVGPSSGGDAAPPTPSLLPETPSGNQQAELQHRPSIEPGVDARVPRARGVSVSGLVGIVKPEIAVPPPEPSSSSSAHQPPAITPAALAAALSAAYCVCAEAPGALRWLCPREAAATTSAIINLWSSVPASNRAADAVSSDKSSALLLEQVLPYFRVKAVPNPRALRLLQLWSKNALHAGLHLQALHSVVFIIQAVESLCGPAWSAYSQRQSGASAADVDGTRRDSSHGSRLSVRSASRDSKPRQAVPSARLSTSLQTPVATSRGRPVSVKLPGAHSAVLPGTAAPQSTKNPVPGPSARSWLQQLYYLRGRVLQAIVNAPQSIRYPCCEDRLLADARHRRRSAAISVALSEAAAAMPEAAPAPWAHKGQTFSSVFAVLSAATRSFDTCYRLASLAGDDYTICKSALRLAEAQLELQFGKGIQVPTQNGRVDTGRRPSQSGTAAAGTLQPPGAPEAPKPEGAGSTAASTSLKPSVSRSRSRDAASGVAGGQTVAGTTGRPPTGRLPTLSTDVTLSVPLKSAPAAAALPPSRPPSTSSRLNSVTDRRTEGESRVSTVGARMSSSRTRSGSVESQHDAASMASAQARGAGHPSKLPSPRNATISPEEHLISAVDAPSTQPPYVEISVPSNLALDLSAQLANPLLLMRSHLCAAELSALRAGMTATSAGEQASWSTSGIAASEHSRQHLQHAHAHWNEAHALFYQLFVDGLSVPVFRVGDRQMLSRLESLLNRLVRMLFVLGPGATERHVHLLDVLLHSQLDLQRARTAARQSPPQPIVGQRIAHAVLATGIPGPTADGVSPWSPFYPFASGQEQRTQPTSASNLQSSCRMGSRNDASPPPPSLLNRSLVGDGARSYCARWSASGGGGSRGDCDVDIGRFTKSESVSNIWQALPVSALANTLARLAIRKAAERGDALRKPGLEAAPLPAGTAPPTTFTTGSARHAASGRGEPVPSYHTARYTKHSLLPMLSPVGSDVSSSRGSRDYSSGVHPEPAAAGAVGGVLATSPWNASVATGDRAMRSSDSDERQGEWRAIAMGGAQDLSMSPALIHSASAPDVTDTIGTPPAAASSAVGAAAPKHARLDTELSPAGHHLPISSFSDVANSQNQNQQATKVVIPTTATVEQLSKQAVSTAGGSDVMLARVPLAVADIQPPVLVAAGPAAAAFNGVATSLAPIAAESSALHSGHSPSSDTIEADAGAEHARQESVGTVGSSVVSDGQPGGDKGMRERIRRSRAAQRAYYTLPPRLPGPVQASAAAVETKGRRSNFARRLGSQQPSPSGSGNNAVGTPAASEQALARESAPPATTAGSRRIRRRQWATVAGPGQLPDLSQIAEGDGGIACTDDSTTDELASGGTHSAVATSRFGVGSPPRHRANRSSELQFGSMDIATAASSSGSNDAIAYRSGMSQVSPREAAGMSRLAGTGTGMRPPRSRDYSEGRTSGTHHPRSVSAGSEVSDDEQLLDGSPAVVPARGLPPSRPLPPGPAAQSDDANTTGRTEGTSLLRGRLGGQLIGNMPPMPLRQQVSDGHALDGDETLTWQGTVQGFAAKPRPLSDASMALMVNPPRYETERSTAREQVASTQPHDEPAPPVERGRDGSAAADQQEGDSSLESSAAVLVLGSLRLIRRVARQFGATEISMEAARAQSILACRRMSGTMDRLRSRLPATHALVDVSYSDMLSTAQSLIDAGASDALPALSGLLRLVYILSVGDLQIVYSPFARALQIHRLGSPSPSPSSATLPQSAADIGPGGRRTSADGGPDLHARRPVVQPRSASTSNAPTPRSTGAAGKETDGAVITAAGLQPMGTSTVAYGRLPRSAASPRHGADTAVSLRNRQRAASASPSLFAPVLDLSIRQFFARTVADIPVAAPAASGFMSKPDSSEDALQDASWAKGIVVGALGGVFDTTAQGSVDWYMNGLSRHVLGSPGLVVEALLDALVQAGLPAASHLQPSQMPSLLNSMVSAADAAERDSKRRRSRLRSALSQILPFFMRPKLPSEPLPVPTPPLVLAVSPRSSLWPWEALFNVTSVAAHGLQGSAVDALGRPQQDSGRTIVPTLVPGGLDVADGFAASLRHHAGQHFGPGPCINACVPVAGAAATNPAAPVIELDKRLLRPALTVSRVVSATAGVVFAPHIAGNGDLPGVVVPISRPGLFRHAKELGWTETIRKRFSLASSLRAVDPSLPRPALPTTLSLDSCVVSGLAGFHLGSLDPPAPSVYALVGPHDLRISQLAASVGGGSSSALISPAAMLLMTALLHAPVQAGTASDPPPAPPEEHPYVAALSSVLLRSSGAAPAGFMVSDDWAYRTTLHSQQPFLASPLSTSLGSGPAFQTVAVPRGPDSVAVGFADLETLRRALPHSVPTGPVRGLPQLAALMPHLIFREIGDLVSPRRRRAEVASWVFGSSSGTSSTCDGAGEPAILPSAAASGARGDQVPPPRQRAWSLLLLQASDLQMLNDALCQILTSEPCITVMVVHGPADVVRLAARIIDAEIGAAKRRGPAARIQATVLPTHHDDDAANTASDVRPTAADLEAGAGTGCNAVLDPTQPSLHHTAAGQPNPAYQLVARLSHVLRYQQGIHTVLINMPPFHGACVPDMTSVAV